MYAISVRQFMQRYDGARLCSDLGQNVFFFVCNSFIKPHPF